MDKLKKYLISTFLITWALWCSDAILVKFTSMRENDILPMILFTVGGFGPTIAAFICFDGKRDKKNILCFLFGCKKNQCYFYPCLFY